MAKYTYQITSINRVKDRQGIIKVTACLLKDGEFSTDREFMMNFSDLKVSDQTKKAALKAIVKQQFTDYIEEETFIDNITEDLKTPALEDV